ncbi:tight adherence protein B [Microcella alkaliphila]|uniref:Tight adherence protein B n=1 Tax=Microcella alkaliphila TaxID=279828 RepID=A0A4Q7TEA8_9MICO|nr:type II secretion system F family protein [Microcella alkaliphila]RZT58167.1 tight adherence protein B [Microcella alkaliphila]
MTVVVALLLSAGVLLVASPWLWPRTPKPADARPGSPGRLADLLARAGLAAVSPAVLVAVMVVLAVIGAGLVLLLVPVLALAPAAAAVCAVAPILLLRARAAARRRALRALWPDVVDLLLSSIRAGRGLPDAISALGDSAPDAVRPAFVAFRRDWMRTARFDESLDTLKRSLADPVADRIVETLRMAREVGGTELPAVLRSLSHYLRAEVAVRGEVEARQSWVRTAARLGVAAPWVVLLMLGSRPEAQAAYNTPGGVALVAAGLAATLVAYRLMVAIGRLPEEGRWFR